MKKTVGKNRIHEIFKVIFPIIFMEICLFFFPIVLGNIAYNLFGHSVFESEKVQRIIIDNSLTAFALRLITFSHILLFFISLYTLKLNNWLRLLIISVFYLIHFIVIYPNDFLKDLSVYSNPVQSFPLFWCLSLTIGFVLLVFIFNRLYSKES